MERNLRTGQVAKELGLAAATVQHYARTGQVPSRLTPGRQYRLNLEEVREALGVSELAGVTVLNSFGDVQRGSGMLSIFGGSNTVAVDALSGLRADPVAPEVEARLRIRAARGIGRSSRPGARWTPAATSGASQLGALLARSGGAAVAVLHR